VFSVEPGPSEDVGVVVWLSYFSRVFSDLRTAVLFALQLRILGHPVHRLPSKWGVDGEVARVPTSLGVDIIYLRGRRADKIRKIQRQKLACPAILSNSGHPKITGVMITIATHGSEFIHTMPVPKGQLRVSIR
jgi:hypothetical protein